MAKLCVNIDHVATVRNARRITEPDPVHAAALCELAGACGITFHLREDRRHITDRDAELLKATVKGLLNMEMACTAEMLAIASRLRPHQVTYVPERREEVTTEGGLDVAGAGPALAGGTAALRALGVAVSMFIDPDSEHIRASAALGATHVEFHTGRYCELYDHSPAGAAEEFARLERACSEARALGLVVNAGHGLNYRNVVPVARIEGMNELNIGHAIVGRAVFAGMDRAVRDMVALVEGRG
ncbi:MAG: pyridoxine 5'-phosphate synthase [Candidatus Sumerlaeia bacterium]|nr:pyridoxine 5'-phosphate synthase [Candidatus Sumerlaeia bacterium]